MDRLHWHPIFNRMPLVILGRKHFYHKWPSIFRSIAYNMHPIPDVIFVAMQFLKHKTRQVQMQQRQRQMTSHVKQYRTYTSYMIHISKRFGFETFMTLNNIPHEPRLESDKNGINKWSEIRLCKFCASKMGFAQSGFSLLSCKDLSFPVLIISYIIVMCCSKGCSMLNNN